MINLTQRERAVLLGCLNDSSGYPYQKYKKSVKENVDNFVKLFDKILKTKSLYEEDCYIAILAVSQTHKYMDRSTLIALHDDVSVKEIKLLLDKLKGGAGK